MELSLEYTYLLLLLLCAIAFPKAKVFVAVALIYMTFLALFRDVTVGTDTMGYEADFHSLWTLKYGSDTIYHNWEIGYMACILLFKVFSDDYMLFISLTFIPLWIGFLKFVRDSHVNWSVALFVFYTLGFYFLSFNAMRQLMVVALILASFPLLHKCKYKEFSIFVIIISYLFHKSEMMMLLLIPLHYYSLRQTMLSKKYLNIALFISFVFFYIGNRYLKDIFFLLLLFLPDTSHYVGYIEGDTEDLGNMWSLMLTLYAFVLVYCKNPKNYIFETNMFVVGIVLFNIFNTFGGFGSRVYDDFRVILIMLIPQMWLDIKTNNANLFRIVTILFCLGYFSFNFILANNCEINPYHFR